MVSVYDHGSPYTQPRLVPSAGRNSFRLNRRKVYTYGPKAGDLCARCTRTRICDGTPYRLLSQCVPADACVGGGADSIMVRRIFINVFSLCAALSYRIKVRFADANRLRVRRTERCQNTRCIQSCALPLPCTGCTVGTVCMYSMTVSQRRKHTSSSASSPLAACACSRGADRIHALRSLSNRSQIALRSRRRCRRGSRCTRAQSRAPS